MDGMNKALQKEQIGRMLEKKGIRKDTVDLEAHIDSNLRLPENIQQLEEKIGVDLYETDDMEKEGRGNRKLAEKEIINLMEEKGYDWRDVVDLVKCEKNEIIKDIKEEYDDLFIFDVLVEYGYCSKKEITSEVLGLKKKVKSLVMENEDYRKLLEGLIKYEEENEVDEKEKESHRAGWEVGEDVAANPGYIAQLLNKGVIKKLYDSNNHTYYKLVNREDTKEALEEIEKLKKRREKKCDELEIKHEDREAEDEDVREFKEILKENDGLEYWYPYVNPKLQNMEQEKKAVLLSLASMDDKYGNRNRIHVLLSGEPGTGKSKLGSWINEKLGHLRSSNRTTQVGLTGDMRGDEVTPGDLVNAHKKHLIIDELDEFDKQDRAGLLESMADGTVTLSGGGKKKEFRAESTVIAITNRTENFREELVDRFDFHIKCESPEGEDGKEIVRGIIDDWNREKGDYEGKKLEKFLNWVKEFEPEIPQETRDEIKEITNKYIDKRDSEKVKIRKYERILRIAIAIARLNHRDVKKEDALRAINLVDGDLLFSSELI